MFASLSTSESTNLQIFIEFEMVRRRKIVNFDPRYLESHGMPSLAFAISIINTKDLSFQKVSAKSRGSVFFAIFASNMKLEYEPEFEANLTDVVPAWGNQLVESFFVEIF